MKAAITAKHRPPKYLAVGPAKNLVYWVWRAGPCEKSGVLGVGFRKAKPLDKSVSLLEKARRCEWLYVHGSITCVGMHNSRPLLPSYLRFTRSTTTTANTTATDHLMPMTCCYD